MLKSEKRPTYPDEPTSSKSTLVTSSRPLVAASVDAGVSSCTACRRLVLSEISPKYASPSSSMLMPSTYMTGRPHARMLPRRQMLT